MSFAGFNKQTRYTYDQSFASNEADGSGSVHFSGKAKT